MRSTFTAEGLDWFASLPASPAARLGDLLVVSGQVPLDDAMNVVAPGDLVAQTRHVFDSIGRLLEAAGAELRRRRRRDRAHAGPP